MEEDVPQIYLLGKTYLTNNEPFYIRNDSITNMAAGERHSILLTESGRVYAFGDNNSGQLGLGHTDNIEKVSCIKSLKFGETGEKVILAACGRESSLVATNRGSLYAFGSNHCCQLGFPSEELIIIQPSPVKMKYFRSKISWKQLSMGAEHACVLTNDGQVYVWGSNKDGQCGLAHEYDIIRTPNELRLEYPIIAISCGYYHTALISEGGRLFLFGNNSERQLGCQVMDQYIDPLEISLPDPLIAVACGNQYTVVLTEKGDVYTCGRGDCGQLGLGRGVLITKHFEIIKSLPKHLTAIAAGESHTAIIDSHGEIYVFGDGKHSNLDNETHSNKFKPYFLDKFEGYQVLKVVCGGCQTIILAQKKSTENTTNSKTKPIKTIAPTNRTNSIDETSTNRQSSLHSESISDSNELSTSMKSLLMNTTHVEINGKFQPTSLHRNNTEYQSLKTGAFDRIVPLNKKTDDFDHTDNLTIKLNFDDEKSLSEENNDQADFQTSSSSTTSGRTSSSTSSVHNENQTESIDELQNSYYSSRTQTLSESYIIDSKSIRTESQTGLFSRIFGEKSSQKFSSTPNQSSRTCLIM